MRYKIILGLAVLALAIGWEVRREAQIRDVQRTQNLHLQASSIQLDIIEDMDQRIQILENELKIHELRKKHKNLERKLLEKEFNAPEILGNADREVDR